MIDWIFKTDRSRRPTITIRLTSLVMVFMIYEITVPPVVLCYQASVTSHVSLTNEVLLEQIVYGKKDCHPWESKHARTIIGRAYYLCSKQMRGLEPSLRILHQFLQKQTWPNKDRSIKLKHWITL
jgi:hypothetical protein